MSRCILDQNQIIHIDVQENYEKIIISPMFMWELFSMIDGSKKEKLIRHLKNISNRIAVTLRSTSCQKREIQSEKVLSFEEIIDHQNTEIIKEWLNDENPSIGQVRNRLASGFISDTFKDKFKCLAQSALPIMKERSSVFQNRINKQVYKQNFEAGNEDVSKDLCTESIPVCFQTLIKKGYSPEQAIHFLRQPSMLYNQTFSFLSICWYRAVTQSLDPSQPATFKIIANDFKDIDLFFCAHHAECLLSGDGLMKYTFSHLKKSHVILSNVVTGYVEVLKN